MRLAWLLGLLCVSCADPAPSTAEGWPWERLTPLRYAQRTTELRIGSHDGSVGLLHPGAEVWLRGEENGRYLITSPWDGVLRDDEPMLTVAPDDLGLEPPELLPPMPPLKGEVAFHQLAHAGPIGWDDDALSMGPLRTDCVPLFIDEVMDDGRRHFRQRIGRFELSAWGGMGLAHRVGGFACAARAIHRRGSGLVMVDPYVGDTPVDDVPPDFVPVTSSISNDLEAPDQLVFLVLRDDGTLACQRWRWSPATRWGGRPLHVLAATQPVEGETWHWAYGYRYDAARRRVSLLGPYRQRVDGALFDGYRCAEELSLVVTQSDRHLMVRGEDTKGVVAYLEEDLETWYRSPEACQADLPAARRVYRADPTRAIGLGVRRCAHTHEQPTIPAWLSHLPVRKRPE